MAGTRKQSTIKQPGRMRNASHIRQNDGISATKAPIFIIAACAVATALVMLLGNPLVWIAADRVVATGQRVYQPADGAVVIGESHTASLSLDDNRAANLLMAAQSLNGLAIMPGETLSVNDILGNTTASPSYLEAPAFAGALVVTERGGGVCQVATALYMAALCADLEIVERFPHTFACDYAPLGLDATLAYGVKDLKIRNNGDSPVYVSVRAKGQTVDASFSGAAHGDGAVYGVESRAVGMRVVPAADAAAELGLDELPADGTANDTAILYDVESYKTHTVNGTVRETTLISADTYLVDEEEVR